jgi:tetratricopeptide (TPR) repeat protein
MSELSLRFTSENESAPISVSLFRPDNGASTSQVAFIPPLDDKQLADLRWYLEEFSFWPSGPDYERAERIENDFETWGRALRDSVLKSNDAARLWQQFIDAGTGGVTPPLLTIDATDPRVLRLPWELLADDGGHIFARGIGVRRRLQNATAAPTKSFELPVRILVVTARPDDAGFIDPRAVSRPLLDAVDELGERVAVEFLYPPTLDALTTRLRDRNAPPVHVVHFDGHGVYDENIGLGYLLFEDDAHKPDRVDANRLGTLLFNCGVPLMVLNACQSAAQKDTNPYASVAARLIRAGVGSVLAMNYSVLVVAAKKFVAAFYGGLASGLTIGQAVDAGRFKLLSDEKRHTLTRRDAKGELVDETIRLRDWFLPAIYQQASDPVVFAPLPPSPSPVVRRQERGSEGVRLPADLPAEPLHGFHGRSWEMLKLERAFADKAIVVLHGFGGVGKTALATEAGRWFHRTGRFPGGAAFVSFEFGGSLQQLCSWVGQTISRDPNFVIGEGDPVQRIADLLRERPALVILDNFESVLGNAPLMPAEELKSILDAVWLWAGVQGSKGAGEKGSRILITTRDVSFNDARFAPSKHCAHIELGGLAEQDALDLAAAILNDHGIDRAKVNRQELTDLMERLGGHPLSLYLVLPQLRAHTAAEISARFEQLLPGFTQGKAKERNESLAVSLEFSLRRLGDATRAALPDLAVFQGGAMENMILGITQMDAELWKTARAEMQAASLVKVEDLPNINFPFLRFHPTLLPYLGTQLASARRTELETRYWQMYYRFANQLYNDDTQHPIEARAIAVREMPNLRHALDLALAAGAMDEAVDFATRISKFLNNFGRWRERDEILKQVSSKQLAREASSSDGKLSKSQYLMESQRGDVLLQQGRAAEAERVFRALLQRMDAGAAHDVDYDRAMTLMRLGRCLMAQGRPTQAIDWHRQALNVFERLGKTNQQSKRMSGKIYPGIGDNLRDIGKFDEAQLAYESGLKIAREVDDDRTVGVALGQLGTLAMIRGDLKTAHERHTEALQTFRAMGEPQMESMAWGNLGNLAQKVEDWDEADRCYREAAHIHEQIRDLPYLATDFNNLAIVAEGAGRLADAERWYLRAQEIKDKVAPQDASTLSNLADLYLSQRRLDEAERYARRAVEIKETLELSSEPWKTYTILAQIVDARGNAVEAARWRRKSQDSFAVYAGAAYQLPQWAGEFISAVSAAVNSGQLDSETEKFLEQMENAGGETALLASAVRRILGGEIDFEKLRNELPYVSAYIVRTILAQLNGEQVNQSNSSSSVVRPSSSVAQSQDQSAQKITLIREQWNEVIQAMVAACNGNQDAANSLAPFLSQMEQKEEWRALIGVLRRILAGERDALVLLRGLDETDTVVAGDALRGLGVDVPIAGQEEEEEDDGKMVSLEQFIQNVVRACKPDAPAGLAEQMHAATRGMATQPSLQPELRELGRVLNQILSGDRNPDVSALHPQLKEIVEKMLEELKT